MLRRTVAFIVLLVHMNSSLLLPQVPERDIYNNNGNQEDDINSVVEYISQVILGHHDDMPEDEDSDNGQNFHLVKVAGYYFEPFFEACLQECCVFVNRSRYTFYSDDKISTVPVDILTPPPRVTLISLQ